MNCCRWSLWWSLTISRGRVDNSQTALIRFTRGLQLNLDKFVNQIEFLGHSAVTPKDIKRLTSLLFKSYCTATLHYGLRREREKMAKLSLRSHTKKSPIYICCTFFKVLGSNICNIKEGSTRPLDFSSFVCFEIKGKFIHVHFVPKNILKIFGSR